jgi:hypothetical protein
MDMGARRVLLFVRVGSGISDTSSSSSATSTTSSSSSASSGLFVLETDSVARE